MSDKPTAVPLRLRPEKAQAIIREIAKDTAMVILSDHAKLRMEQREILEPARKCVE